MIWLRVEVVIGACLTFFQLMYSTEQIFDCRTWACCCRVVSGCPALHGRAAGGCRPRCRERLLPYQWLVRAVWSWIYPWQSARDPGQTTLEIPVPFTRPSILEVRHRPASFLSAHLAPNAIAQNQSPDAFATTIHPWLPSVGGHVQCSMAVP